MLLCLTISNAQTVFIPDLNLKEELVTHLFPTIDENGDGEIQVSEALNTTSIRISNPNQDDEPMDLTGLEAFTNIEELRIYAYSIPPIDVSIYPALVNLDLGRCQISSIDVSNNLNLKYLSLDDNALSSVDVSLLTELETLDLRYNDNIESIDVSNNIKLTKLALDRNNFSVLDVTKNIDLIELTLPWNNLISIDLSNNTKLKKLSLTYNEITAIDLAPLELIENVNLSDNDLTSVDFSSNLNLQYIYLNGNDSLSNINITQNSKLEWLNLTGTALETIDVSDKPLLRNLNIWGNDVLKSVNMKNGNNTNLTLGFVGIKDLPLLESICVDNIIYATDIYLVDGVDFTYLNDCNSSLFNTLTGVVNFDINNNNCSSSNSLSNVLIEVFTDNLYHSTITNENGVYEIEIPNTGDFIVSVAGELAANFLVPDNQMSFFTDFGNSEVVDFCIQAAATDDLNILILPVNEARPGFIAQHDIVFVNEGTSVINGTITLEYESDIQSVELIQPNYDTIESNKIIWSFSDLQPYEHRIIFADFRIDTPPTVNGDDILSYKVDITSNVIEDNIDNNSNELQQIVVNSFDPNDKRVMQGSEIYVDEVGNYLDYIIRFQNTGTASAINVSIEDVLDQKLDWSTFKVISSSHDYEVQISNQNEVEFIFNNINLPDSTSDEEGSNGYIAFKIKPRNDVVLGDIIQGQSSIFFDFNLPIITNNVSTEVVEYPVVLSIVENELKNALKVYPVPVTDNTLFIENNSSFKIKKLSYVKLNGEEIFFVIDNTNENENLIELDLSLVLSKLFFLKIVSDEGVVSIIKVIK